MATAKAPLVKIHNDAPLWTVELIVRRFEHEASLAQAINAALAVASKGE